MGNQDPVAEKADASPERELPEAERETIWAMLAIYCRDHHGYDGGSLCSECEELLEYACERVRRCPLGERRTTCGKCPIHCYKPAMRERIRAVMAYAGPRMFKERPLLAARHLIKGMQPPPAGLVGDGAGKKSRKP